ncbi:MAG: protoporphyrinogen oxidase HemJ [Aestuariivirgaceae bacterium]|nr:protoporphyrinogen oxidase HemJ [Aestuariivirgaceae bacterium]
MADYYLWIKAAHVMAVIAWMAGLFYLPRLFVYHVDAVAGSVQSETFKVMERRLYKAIMMPAMIAAWVFGLMLVSVLGLGEGWLWVKLLMVVGLTGFQGVLGRHVRLFSIDGNVHSGRYFRILNEVPTVAMVVIVIMVIVKPF